MRFGHERFVAARSAPDKRAPRSSAAVFSVFLMAGCTPAVAEASLVKRTHHLDLTAKTALLVSKTGQAVCRFEDNKLTYSHNGNERTIKLDTKTPDATRMLCSDRYTVLLTPDRAVVSLGAKEMLSGGVSIGTLGGKIVLANSYSVDIRAFVSEGIKTIAIKGRMLHLTTRQSRYYLDLSNPYRWFGIR